jgi:hypothetical protein
MNETGYLRAQLALERAHLQVILQAVRQASPTEQAARPVADYLDWASRRLVSQLARLSGAAAVRSDGAPAPSDDVGAEHALALLTAWSDQLEALAGRTLHITQWRHIAQLNADSILQERQLYAAACAAAGLS